MKCPLCNRECEQTELKTFEDYAKYLYSVLCVETVKVVIEDANRLSDERLEQLRKCCETISNYAYQFDRSIYGTLATPKSENSQ